MEKCEVKDVTYEKSDTIEMQGTHADTAKYRNQGYYEETDRNGYHVLVKTAQVKVAIESSTGEDIVNLKQEICNHYGQERISEKLVETFKKDIRDENIYICKDDNSEYHIEQNK